MLPLFWQCTCSWCPNDAARIHSLRLLGSLVAHNVIAAMSIFTVSCAVSIALLAAALHQQNVSCAAVVVAAHYRSLAIMPRTWYCCSVVSSRSARVGWLSSRRGSSTNNCTQHSQDRTAAFGTDTSPSSHSLKRVFSAMFDRQEIRKLARREKVSEVAAPMYRCHSSVSNDD